MDIAIANDLVPSSLKPDELSHFNSRLRQVDLFTEVTSPVIVGILLLLNQPMLLGFYVVALWNVISFFQEPVALVATAYAFRWLSVLSPHGVLLAFARVGYWKFQGSWRCIRFTCYSSFPMGRKALGSVEWHEKLHYFSVSRFNWRAQLFLLSWFIASALTGLATLAPYFHLHPTFLIL